MVVDSWRSWPISSTREKARLMAKNGGRKTRGYRFLGKVSSPRDLKSLTPEDLEVLAGEIRDKIIATIAKTGGHLAPNLGAVELTIGLHRVLDCPKDKIVWDVGHQSYTHKLLTGRYAEFDTIRQHGGLSGFPKHDESPYDCFDSGHASNSIAVALGLAEGRDKQGGDETIVAVIGDGSLTGGLAYEALNQAGHWGTHLIIVLNDNVMSISPNVGAMASYLARIRLDPAYNKLRDDIEDFLRKIPAVGEIMLGIGEHMRDGLKHLVVPGMIFEELGFTYVGPIDGHDIAAVEQNILGAKNLKGPVVVHALTQKGTGYAPAEEHPEKFHGTNPYVVETGEPVAKGGLPSYSAVFGEAAVELAAADERIVAITAAMSSGTGLSKFAAKYPDRFYDVGIAEQLAVTFSAGLALQGLLPIVAIYSTFLERAYDQLIQDVALQGLHVVFAVDRGGLVGEDGPTHHGVYDLSYLRSIPGFTVMCPSDEVELRDMLYTATQLAGPVALRYPRGTGLGLPTPQGFSAVPIGEAKIIKKGKDICLIGVGRMLHRALEAAALLEDEGVSCTVVNPRFVKPLDAKIIPAMAAGHGLIVTIEENSIRGGFGSGVLELLAEQNAGPCQVLALGIPDEFMNHGATDLLLANVGLSPEGIARMAFERYRGTRRRFGAG